MNGVIFGLTMRQLFGRKRALAMVAVALIPVGLAVIARLSADDINRVEWTTNTMYQGFIAGTVLPLVALVFGTAALGSEFEEGTAVYLLTKPIRRRAIVIPKVLSAWIATSAIVIACGALAGGIMLYGEGEVAVVVGFTIALAGGALAYTALFVMLSIITTRALIAGLVYVFLWEGVLTTIFTGTRIMSVREYTLAAGDLLADTPDAIINPELSGPLALVLIAAMTLITTWLGIRGLERWEISEGG